MVGAVRNQLFGLKRGGIFVTWSDYQAKPIHSVRQSLAELPVQAKGGHAMLTTERLWKVSLANQPQTGGFRFTLTNDLALFLAIATLISVLLSACNRPASRPAVIYATSSAPEIAIDRVQINQGAGVYILGHSTLPDGECVNTELLSNHKTVDWWPRDVCVTIDSGHWEMLVALGRNGAPARLEPNIAYEIHAWWPKDPSKTSARFP